MYCTKPLFTNDCLSQSDVSYLVVANIKTNNYFEFVDEMSIFIYTSKMFKYVYQ